LFGEVAPKASATRLEAKGVSGTGIVATPSLDCQISKVSFQESAVSRQRHRIGADDEQSDD